MSYAICIEAAGVPVLSYHEDGSYQGTWFALTANGFYTGSYGSCSGCDWREGELMSEGAWGADDNEALTKKIDAGIGREILKAKPLSKAEFLTSLKEMWLDDKDAVLAWVEKVSP